MCAKARLRFSVCEGRVRKARSSRRRRRGRRDGTPRDARAPRGSGRRGARGGRRDPHQAATAARCALRVVVILAVRGRRTVTYTQKKEGSASGSARTPRVWWAAGGAASCNGIVVRARRPSPPPGGAGGAGGHRRGVRCDAATLCAITTMKPGTGRPALLSRARSISMTGQRLADADGRGSSPGPPARSLMQRLRTARITIFGASPAARARWAAKLAPRKRSLFLAGGA